MTVLVTKEAGLRKIQTQRQKAQSRSPSGIRDCKYCGSNHQCRQFPAYGKTCKICGKKNTLQRSVIQEAKANLAALVVRSHLSIERLSLTRNQVMTR